MASVIEICNIALSILGQKGINSLDELGPEAYACRLHWPHLRDEILRKHPWNCTTKRANLNRLIEVPPFDFDYYHQLPADCLAVLEVVPENYFVVEGRKLLCSSREVSIRYTQTTDDSTKFDSQLSAAMAYLLAAELCYNITKSTSLTESLHKMGMDKLADAKASDAFEGKTRDRRPSRWLTAKYK
jgi:hypothetical protein